MSDENAETWRVIDGAGVAHDVAVVNHTFDTGKRWSVAHSYGRDWHSSARAAVLLHAADERWDAIEFVAPGQRSRYYEDNAASVGGHHCEGQPSRSEIVAAVRRYFASCLDDGNRDNRAWERVRDARVVLDAILARCS